MGDCETLLKRQVGFGALPLGPLLWAGGEALLQRTRSFVWAAAPAGQLWLEGPSTNQRRLRSAGHPSAPGMEQGMERGRSGPN